MKENQNSLEQSAAKIKIYKCLMCPKAFSNQVRLNHHIICHTKEKPFKCPTCSAAFGSKGNLKIHTRHVHEGAKWIYRTRDKNSTKIKCPVCSFACGTRSTMKVHSLKHSEEKPYSCSNPGCGFKTKHSGCLKRHVARIHNPNHERRYECQLDGCSYKTTEPYYLRKHLKAHSNERPFPCEFPGCGDAFKTKAVLKAHTYRVHGDEKPFKCSTCDFETKYEIRLREHQDEHNNIKRFQCPFPSCNYACNHSNAIRSHFDRNHRPKSVLCPTPGCNYRCGSNAVLKVHVNNAHVVSILKCPEESCNFSSRYLHVLRKHVSRRHGDVQLVSRLPSRRPRQRTCEQAAVSKIFACSFPNCDHQSEYPHQHDRHIKTHDKDKWKYKCTYCNVKFQSYRRLEGHTQGHTGERPYRCSHCPYTTAQSCLLRYHAGKHHSIHVISRELKTAKGRICRTCRRTCTGHNEFVLHSMKHLQAVVVLERLQVNIK